jgi:hypothetical protein
MDYQGIVADIPFGGLGLMTDVPDDRLPPGSLRDAKNVSLKNGAVAKEPGSRRFNSSALGSGVVAMYDWKPESARQYWVYVLRNGTVGRLEGQGTSVTVSATGDAPASLTVTDPPVFVQGGAEAPGQTKKLFLLCPDEQVQVIEGTAVTRSNLTTPAADWASGNYPYFGLMHRNRLVVMNSDRVYLSDTTDHEKFLGGNALQFPVFPGQGERIKFATVYRNRLFIFKYPTGVYYLDDSDPDTVNWGVREVSRAYGAVCALPIMNDLLVKTSSGSVASVSAADQLGDVESADLLRQAQIEKFIKARTASAGNYYSQALYFEDQKLAFFTYRTHSSTANNFLLRMDFNFTDGIRFSYSTKDAPNCLALRDEGQGVLWPYYGAEDGYIYRMEDANWNVAGSAYEARFEVPGLDFRFLDPKLKEVKKNFDFLEVSFEEVGGWDLSVDVYLDGRFSETLTFRMAKNPGLDAFELDADYLNRSGNVFSFLKPLHGQGRRIGFVFRQSGLNQGFKVTGIRVYFESADLDQDSNE